jgi:hypothetical protein
MSIALRDGCVGSDHLSGAFNRWGSRGNDGNRPNGAPWAAGDAADAEARFCSLPAIRPSLRHRFRGDVAYRLLRGAGSRRPWGGLRQVFGLGSHRAATVRSSLRELVARISCT